MSDQASDAGFARRASKRAYARLESAFSIHGWAFRRLSLSYSSNVAGDTLIAIALADSLFFSVPTAQARGNVITYLLITVAPFAVIAPLLNAVFTRFPGAYRTGLTAASLLRAAISIGIMRIGGGFELFVMAFALLGLSRIYGISRSAVLPTALPRPVALVAANARVARMGIIAGALVAPIGFMLNRWVGIPATLALAALCFVVSAAWANGLRVDLEPVPGGDLEDPSADTDAGSLRDGATAHATDRLPTSDGTRALRFSRIATAVVRMLNGYLLLLMAFAFRDAEEGLLSFGALLGAAGLGFAIASSVSPFLERKLAEEPIIVAALALEAAAAFITAQVFDVGAAAVLACSAGLAWGTAKFGYDGLLQQTLDPHSRGAAFTRSETLFQLAWVAGAILPVIVRMPTSFGLLLAGCVALTAQVIIVSGLLVSVREGT
jgi:hypothetical protein